MIFRYIYGHQGKDVSGCHVCIYSWDTSFYCCQEGGKSIALICERVNSTLAEVNSNELSQGGI